MKQRMILALVAVTWIACAAGRAQSPTPAAASTAKTERAPAKPAANESTSPLKLEDVGRVDTEATARQAAQHLAKRQAANTKDRAKDQAANGPQGESADNPPAPADAVTEFHAAPAGSEVTTPDAQEHQGRTALDRVHGELYGVTGAARHATGESIGATSKSGKTSVYLETQQGRDESRQPQPH